MALGRKVFDAVKYVSYRDTAVRDEVSWRAYATADFDLDKLLPWVDGKEPTIFTLRPLTHRQRITREMFEHPLQKATHTVRCGLVDVSGFVVEENGVNGALPELKREKQGDLGLLLTEKWIADADLGEILLTELSAAIDRISEATPPL